MGVRPRNALHSQYPGAVSAGQSNLSSLSIVFIKDPVNKQPESHQGVATPLGNPDGPQATLISPDFEGAKLAKREELGSMNMSIKMALAALAGSALLQVGASASAATMPQATSAEALHALPASIEAGAPAPSTTPAVEKTAAQPVSVTVETINEETDQWSAEVSIPRLYGLEDAAYETELNAGLRADALAALDDLKRQAAEDAASAKKAGYPFRPHYLSLGWELTANGSDADGRIVSLALSWSTYSGGAHGMHWITASNVLNEAKAKSLALKDVFGSLYPEAVNGSIEASMAATPEVFFPDAFTDVTEDTVFYVSKGEAVVVFQPYEIAPYAAGVPEFHIPLPQLAAEAPPQMMLVAEGKLLGPLAEGTKPDDATVSFAPLRAVAGALGYTLAWDDEAGAAELTKGAQTVRVQPGINAYAVDAKPPATLDAAPYISPGGTLLVPLRFATDILNAAVKTEGHTIYLTIGK